MALDVNLVKPFLEATQNVMEQFGITDIKKLKVAKKVGLNSNFPVTVVVGILGDVRGNVTYSMPIETAKNIASAMMMGMPVFEFDDMAKSAIAELSNMITGNSSAIFEGMKKMIDISPPTLITGRNIIAWISQVETIMVELDTSAGKLEVNVGLEI